MTGTSTMIADGVQGANSEAKVAREIEFISGLTLNLVQKMKKNARKTDTKSKPRTNDEI
jgi:hypothetical protein